VGVLHATVVGADHTLSAVVFLSLLALVAAAARVNEATNTGVVTNLELLDIFADSLDDTSDLVTRNHREDGGAPLLTGLMDVRVADASIGSLNVDIVITNGATLNSVGLELATCLHGGVALGIEST
jgi:hypothetical protein